MKNNKKPSSKRALYLSAISLGVCLLMLMGTTFAWFTDAVSSKGNKITSGTLSIEAEAYRANAGTQTWYDPKAKADVPLLNGTGVDLENDLGKFTGSTLFEETNFEPNKSGAIYIQVTNKGNLPADLSFNITGADDSVVPGGPALSEVLKYQVVGISGDPTTTGSAPSSWAGIPVLASNTGNLYNQPIVTIYPAGDADSTHLQSAWVRLDYYMCAWAPNAYQGLTVNFGITAIADQHNTYGYAGMDDTYHQYKVINTLQDLLDAAADTTNPGCTLIFMSDIDMTSDITFVRPVNIDLNGYTLNTNGNTITFGPYKDPTYTPCAIEIANGTIIGGTINFNNDNYIVNLTDDLNLIGTVINDTPINTHDNSNATQSNNKFIDYTKTDGSPYVWSDDKGGAFANMPGVGEVLTGNTDTTRGAGPYFDMSQIFHTMPANGFTVTMVVNIDPANFPPPNPGNGVTIGFEPFYQNSLTYNTPNVVFNRTATGFNFNGNGFRPASTGDTGDNLGNMAIPISDFGGNYTITWTFTDNGNGGTICTGSVTGPGFTTARIGGITVPVPFTGVPGNISVNEMNAAANNQVTIISLSFTEN